MGKKKSKNTQVQVLESEIKPLLELKFTDPLFSLAAHPSKPIIALGFASGYMQMIQYDADKLMSYSQGKKQELEEKQSKSKETKPLKFWRAQEIAKDTEVSINDDGLKILWKTKRHKSSVRSICFNAEGDEVYSVGSDGVLKKADTLTGKVIKKCSLKTTKPTKVLRITTHPIVIIGDENGDVYSYDSETLELKNKVSKVHEDAINDIIPYAKKSAYKFISVGSTNVSVFDIRQKAPISQSDNQEDEVLSTTFVNPEMGETLICGMGEGIVTVWKESKNGFSDQISRIKISKDESVDCCISTLKEDECCWCGCSDGSVSKVDVKRGKLIETRIHSFNDEVGWLDLDCEYRLISAGMDKLKIWDEKDDDDAEEEEEDSMSEDFSDSDSDSGTSEGEKEENVEEDNEEFAGFSDEEVESKEEEKEPEQPKKKAKLSTKQLRNLQKHEHGIRRFDDL